MARSIQKKKPQYDERSKDFARPIEEARNKGKEFLAQKCLEAAEKVYSTMWASGDAQILRLQFDAAKEIVKANGIYTEKIEHSGDVNFTPFKISRGDE